MDEMDRELAALTSASVPLDVRVEEWIVWSEKMCLLMAASCRAHGGYTRTQVLGVEVHPCDPNVKILTIFVPMSTESDETSLPPL